MSKIKRNQIITGLVKKGHSEVVAREIYSDLLEVLKEELHTKNEVQLSGIGTIVPKHTEAGIKKFLGKDRFIDESLSLSFRTSKAFGKEFRLKYSEEATKSKSIRDFGKNYAG